MDSYIKKEDKIVFICSMTNEKEFPICQKFLCKCEGTNVLEENISAFLYNMSIGKHFITIFKIHK